jgi:hypothetical protein
VCTAAERGYALEAWRVLDPDGWLIPVDQRKASTACAAFAVVVPCLLPDVAVGSTVRWSVSMQRRAG